MRVAGNVETYNQLKIRFNRFRNILRQSIKDADVYISSVFLKNSSMTLKKRGPLYMYMKNYSAKRKKHPAISSIMMVRY